MTTYNRGKRNRISDDEIIVISDDSGDEVDHTTPPSHVPTTNDENVNLSLVGKELIGYLCDVQLPKKEVFVSHEEVTCDRRALLTLLDDNIALDHKDLSMNKGFTYHDAFGEYQFTFLSNAYECDQSQAAHLNAAGESSLDPELTSSACLRWICSLTTTMIITDPCSSSSSQHRSLQAPVQLTAHPRSESASRVAESVCSHWRSGGSYDCGGWDFGLSASGSSQQHESTTAESRWTIHTPFKDGIHTVEFHSSLPTLQAFFLCIAL
ncbi:hypothetical protein LINPERPRIM_LOCUS38815 [Linum perenne]